jgi:hypothetical protein
MPTYFEFTDIEEENFVTWKEHHARVCSLDAAHPELNLTYSFKPSCACGCGIRTIRVKCKCGVRVDIIDRGDW